MMISMLENVANLGTAVCGALAAYFWWKVAMKIPRPRKTSPRT